MFATLQIYAHSFRTAQAAAMETVAEALPLKYKMVFTVPFVKTG